MTLDEVPVQKNIKWNDKLNGSFEKCSVAQTLIWFV